MISLSDARICTKVPAERTRRKPVSDLYDTDILIWSEQQAALLRRIAADERINDLVDWENVIEEIESVGSDQLHAVESFLMQALIHISKIQGWPNSREVPHWEAEVQRFLADAITRFAPSMRQRLDLGKIYRRALRAVPKTIDGQPPQPLPQSCPMTLDELLAEP
jgi:hypothetical protein